MNLKTATLLMIFFMASVTDEFPANQNVRNRHGKEDVWDELTTVRYEASKVQEELENLREFGWDEPPPTSIQIYKPREDVLKIESPKQIQPAADQGAVIENCPPEILAVPGIPETPANPGFPDIPEIPEFPDIPEIPETPANPGIPDIPAEPENPDIPADTDVLEVSESQNQVYQAVDLRVELVEYNPPEIPEAPGIPDIPADDIPEDDIPADTDIPTIPNPVISENPDEEQSSQQLEEYTEEEMEQAGEMEQADEIDQADDPEDASDNVELNAFSIRADIDNDDSDDDCFSPEGDDDDEYDYHYPVEGEDDGGDDNAGDCDNSTQAGDEDKIDCHFCPDGDDHDDDFSPEANEGPKVCPVKEKQSLYRECHHNEGPRVCPVKSNEVPRMCPVKSNESPRVCPVKENQSVFPQCQPNEGPRVCQAKENQNAFPQCHQNSYVCASTSSTDTWKGYDKFLDKSSNAAGLEPGCPTSIHTDELKFETSMNSDRLKFETSTNSGQLKCETSANSDQLKCETSANSYELEFETCPNYDILEFESSENSAKVCTEVMRETPERSAEVCHASEEETEIECKEVALPVDPNTCPLEEPETCPATEGDYYAGGDDGDAESINAKGNGFVQELYLSANNTTTDLDLPCLESQAPVQTESLPSTTPDAQRCSANKLARKSSTSLIVHPDFAPCEPVVETGNEPQPVLENGSEPDAENYSSPHEKYGRQAVTVSNFNGGTPSDEIGGKNYGPRLDGAVVSRAGKKRRMRKRRTSRSNGVEQGGSPADGTGTLYGPWPEHEQHRYIKP